MTFISVIAALFPATGYASGLVPWQCSMVNNSYAYHPVRYVNFDFDCIVCVTENSVGTVYSENQPVATGSLSTFSFNTEGRVNLIFEPPLILPKGKTYKVVVPADVIFKEEEPTVTNDELTVEFYVPENLGYARPSVDEGSVVDRERTLGFSFWTEVAKVRDRKFLLYRKDVPIIECTCHASWDWGIGQAFIDFGGWVNFESGVEYTVRLPKDCVSALDRPDITNEEAAVSFFGGFTGHVEPLMYTGNSLSGAQPTDVLGEVPFYYDQPVSLCVTSSVQLYNVTDGVVAKEAVPTPAKEEDLYVMTVDFENTPLVPGKEYSIIIPEATVVLVNSDIRVNQCNTVPVVNNSGVSEIGNTDCDINVENGSVTVTGTSAGSPVTLLSLDGKVLYNAKSNGGTVSVPVGTTGIYLLSVNGKTHKIAVRN